MRRHFGLWEIMMKYDGCPYLELYIFSKNSGLAVGSYAVAALPVSVAAYRDSLLKILLCKMVNCATPLCNRYDSGRNGNFEEYHFFQFHVFQLSAMRSL